MRSRILVALAALALASPTLSAGAASCAEATDEGAIALADIYLASDLTLWTESNAYPGLQTAPCADDNGRERPADSPFP